MPNIVNLPSKIYSIQKLSMFTSVFPNLP